MPIRNGHFLPSRGVSRVPLELDPARRKTSKEKTSMTNQNSGVAGTGKDAYTLGPPAEVR